MNLDDFITKAVQQVKNSKKTGKKGRNARRELKKDNLTFLAAKAELQALAKKAKEDAWKTTALVQLTTRNKCPNCNQINICSAGAVYIEKHHKSLGRILKDISEFPEDIPENTPRRIEEMFRSEVECLTCFMQDSTIQELTIQKEDIGIKVITNADTEQDYLSP